MTLSSGEFNFTRLERVRWGVPALAAVLEEVEKRQAGRVLVVTSPSLRRQSDVPDTIVRDLASRCVGVFDRLKPHTPISCVLDLYQTVIGANADLIVTLGGGTPIDTAKAVIAMMAAGVTDPMDVADRENNWQTLPIRQIACPTTLSGAEFSDLAGLTDPQTNIKHGVSGIGIGPATVVLDPDLASGTPAHLWTSTGIRAVDHAIETVCSIAATPFTDCLALDALSSLSRALRKTNLDPQDKSARLEAQLAVWMASAGLDRTPYGASHGIGHQLGAVAGLPHGVCSCVMLPAVLDWNRTHNGAAQDKIAKRLNAENAANGVRALVAELGLPGRLSDAGVARTHLPEIAQKSLSNRWVKTNPRPIETADQILEILEAAY
ncbi:MAG: iron-containing alcohol dehydrogenase [Hyphomonadaceae bacterium]|nr:iron-containing alcohol dehydrogenase [Hyphomonadaceae bacterium]